MKILSLWQIFLSESTWVENYVIEEEEEKQFQQKFDAKQRWTMLKSKLHTSRLPKGRMEKCVKFSSESVINFL